MKTLRVTLADIIGPTGVTGESTATVHARYVDTSGRGRDVHLTDGTIVVPVRRVASPDGDPEVFDFDVYANDVAPVREVDYGHLVEVSWTVVAPTGAKSSGVKRVQITDSMASVVQLGLLATPTPVPPYTGGYALAPDLAAEVVTRAAADAALDGRVDALEVAPPAHAHPLAAITDAGTAAAADVGDFATAAQGVKADSATQPGDLATVATTGVYADLSGKPALGTAAATAATDYATAAQGVKADTAVQPADLTGVGAPAAGQTLGALLDIGVGATALTVLGDSTGNDWFEWPQRLCNAMGVAYPDLTVRHALWNDATQAYGALATVYEGSNPPGEVTTVVTLVDDQFDRVAAELIGSTPDVGAVWQGTTGRFSLDGSTMSGIPGLAHTYPSPAHASGPGPVTVTASVTMDQAPSGVLKTVEVGAKAVDANSHVFVTMSVPTGGGRTWALWKRIAGVATKLADGTVDAAFTSKVIPISVTVDGADVSATVDGETITGTLTGGDVTALTSGWGVVLWSKTSATGVSVDFITATTTSVSMTDGYTLTVYNGSMPGSTLAYQQARVADMVPAETSTVVLSSSHNYGTTGAGDYLTAVRDFIAALTAVRPYVDVIASSQNPQFAPRTAEQIEAHAIRCGALRGEAFRLGWGYWPVYEKWTQLAGGGAAWVNADGLHPLYDVTGVNDGGTFWASIALDYVARLALVDAG